MNVLVIGANWGKVVAEGFRQHGCKVAVRTYDWQSMLPAADVVAVCVPPTVQYYIVEECLKAGKHVLCEKPFGLNGIQATILRDLAKSQKLVGAIDFEFRYEPALQRIKQWRQSIRAVTWCAPERQVTGWKADPLQGGGLTSEFTSHVWDYLNWLGCPEASIDVRRGPEAFHCVELNGDLVEWYVYRQGWPDSRPACVAALIGDFLATINGKYCPDLPTFDDGLRVHERLAKVTG